VSFDVSVVTGSWPLFARGLANTVLFCVVGVGAGLAVGVLVAFARLSRRRPVRWLAAAFVEVVRDTPFLVQVFLVFYALPAFGLRLEATTAGLCALSLYGGAYFAESIRGAILSVPRGQLDAARAVGMPYALAMRRVVFPQMMGYLLPSLTNQIIGLVKESAVLSVITVPELTMAAQVVLGTTFSPVEAFTMVALLYWALTAAVAAGMRGLERRALAYRRAEARGGAGTLPGLVAGL
jgi:polar amino acid transport system permease protein